MLLTATTFAAVSVLYADTVASAGLTRSLVRAGATQTDVTVTAIADADEFEGRAAIVDRELAAALGATAPDVLSTVRSSGSYALPGGGATPDLTVFESVDRLPEVAALVAGAYPVAGATPIQVAMPEPAAAALGISVGDELRVTSRVDAGREVADAGRRHRPAWRTRATTAGPSTDSLPTASSRANRSRRSARCSLDRADLAATGEPRLQLAWHARPDLARVAPENVPGLRAGVGALPARLDDQLGADRVAEVRTGLPEVLAAAAGALLVGDTGILLLDLQLAIIGTYALILVAALMREWRRAETALLRSRGAGAEHLVRITATEALWLVAAAVIVGPLLAWLALSGAAALGWLGAGAQVPSLLGGPALAIVGAAGLLGFLGLVVPTLVGMGPLSAVRRSVGRQVHMTAAHRSGLDLALVVLAAVALWQLRAYGGPLTTSMRGSLGVDPLLVAAPAIGLIAGAILAMRGIPWLARRLASVLEGRAGMTGWLGSRELARRPLRFTAPALLLVVATGLGGFAVAYASTWTTSQRDQVGHALGAPARLVLPDLAPGADSRDIGARRRGRASARRHGGRPGHALRLRPRRVARARRDPGHRRRAPGLARGPPTGPGQPAGGRARGRPRRRPARPSTCPRCPTGRPRSGWTSRPICGIARSDGSPIDLPAGWAGLRGVRRRARRGRSAAPVRGRTDHARRRVGAGRRPGGHGRRPARRRVHRGRPAPAPEPRRGRRAVHRRAGRRPDVGRRR